MNVKLNKEDLIDEIRYSIKHCHVNNRHTNKLGLMLIKIADINIRTLRITSVSKVDLEDIRQEMIIEMILTINRYMRTGVIDNDPFAVFMTACRWNLFRNLKKIRKVSERKRLLEELSEEFKEQEEDEH